MYKRKYIIALLSSSFILGACNKFLDVIPENALTYSNSFLTENEVNATTSTIHFFINTEIKPSSIFNDAGVLYDFSNYGMETANWNPNAVAKRIDDWKGFYDIIFEGNLMLDNIHRAENLSKERVNFHVGQARFAIGLSYFELVRRYGDCVITENSKVVKAYGVSPMLDVVNVAIENAEKAYEILPVAEQLRGLNNSNISSKQIASKGAAVALLAQLYAWKGSIIDLYQLEGSSQDAYTKSIEYASLLINGEVGNYQLCNSAEELSEYLSNPEKDNPEAIFSLAFDKGRSSYSVTPNNVAMSFAMWPVKKTDALVDIYYTDKVLYKSTIKKLYEDQQDERKTAFFYNFDEEHIVDGKDYAIPYKFKNALHEESAWSPSGYEFRSINANYVYWRLADIILLRAECYAKLNNSASAIADLNTIRSRANAALYPSPYDKEDLRKTIFRERDKEFILENGHRYFDIIRNNYIKEELRGKFKELTLSDIKKGALFLPIPSGAFSDKDGNITNTLIRQKEYWLPYL